MTLSEALDEMRRLEPSFFWRLRYQDRPFTGALIERLNELEEAEYCRKSRITEMEK